GRAYFTRISPYDKSLSFERLNSEILCLKSLTHSEMEDSVYNITWSPDSLGLFIFTDVNIYYLSVPDGEQLHPLLSNCSPKRCEFPRFIWRP
ncbi:MAG: hypothetical protein L0287_25215, partial [Anaerolineae bacterium]|nr:hypothetical protein [Anaerolineae bacterium]